jgi:hypothetical protein
VVFLHGLSGCLSTCFPYWIQNKAVVSWIGFIITFVLIVKINH